MAHDNVLVIRQDFPLSSHRTDTTSMMLALNNTVDDKELHCEQGDLLGPLGLLVQGLLALIAFSALIVKRYCEPLPERRSWKIWFFDTSKQGFGAAIIHFANVLLAGVFMGDPCTWYFISFMLDSTIGLLIIYLGLKVSQIISVREGWDHLLLGEYGNPPKAKAWLGQCLIYIIVMIVEKILITLLVMFDFWKKVREFILSPIRNPALELVIVMFIVPFIVNAIIFWVVDNFLKRKAFKISPHTPPGSSAGASTNTSQGPAATGVGGVKYFSAVERVRYYERTEHADESESDVLLSLDDEDPAMVVMRGGGGRTGVSNGGHRGRENSTSSQYHLLAAEIT